MILPDLVLPARGLAPGTPLWRELAVASRVFLSPHFDDLAFSLGLTVRALGGGTLVNLFTRSINLPNPEMAAERARSPQDVSALRDAEDAVFAESAGLTRMALGLAEPPLHGRHSKDARGLDEDRAQLRTPLAAALAGLAATLPPPRALFAPAAIGSHVNHLAAMLAVLDLLPDLRDRYRVFFYEDLPYSSSFFRRQRGLVRLAQLPGLRLEARHAFRLADRHAEKLSMVAGYRSQHRHPPRARRYSPAAPFTHAPHEAFWSLVDSR